MGAMMTNDMQERIKKLLEVDSREYFMINNSKFECHFWNRDTNVKPFSEWKKDENSPSLFCEARLSVYDNADRGKMFEGMILVQRDDSAASPLSAVLYVKPLGAEKWQNMHTIVNLIGNATSKGIHLQWMPQGVAKTRVNKI